MAALPAYLLLLSPGQDERTKTELICHDLLGSQMPLQLPQSRDDLLLLARSNAPTFQETLATRMPGLPSLSHPFSLLTEALRQSLLPLCLTSGPVLSNHFSCVLAKSQQLSIEAGDTLHPLI